MKSEYTATLEVRDDGDAKPWTVMHVRLTQALCTVENTAFSTVHKDRPSQ